LAAQVSGLECGNGAIQTLGERGLAGTGGTHDDDQLSVPKSEGHVLQRVRLLPGVTKAEVFEAQRLPVWLRCHPCLSGQSRAAPASSKSHTGSNPRPTSAAPVPVALPLCGKNGKCSAPLDSRFPSTMPPMVATATIR